VQPYRPQKFYYQTADLVLPDRQPITSPPPTTTIQIGGYLQAKIDAFKAHTSQSPLFARVEDNLKRLGAEERFHLAASMNPAPGLPETDLFAGISQA